MHFCRDLALEALSSPVSEEAAQVLSDYRREHHKWAKTVIHKRNRVGAHGHEANKVVTGTGHWGTSGTVGIALMDLNDLTVINENIRLEPDEEILRLLVYINGLMPLLENCWLPAPNLK